MPEEKRAGGKAGNSISSIVGAAMDEAIEDHPDFFDETAGWGEEEATLDFGDSGEAEDEVDEPAGNGVPPKETAKSNGIGIDKVLQELEATNPEYAKVVRGLQAEYTKSRQASDENVQLKKEMETIVKEWQEIKASADDEDEPDGEELIEEDALTTQVKGMYENMDPAHKELFSYMMQELGVEWAQKNGFVKMSDIDARETQKQQAEARNSVLRGAVDQGIEEYGELFGDRVDGKFVINPEIRDKVQSVYAALGGSNYQGTLLDIFKMACADDIVAYKLSNPKPSQPEERSPLQKRLNAMKVASGTTTATANPNFYTGERNKKGRLKESIYDVAKKASRHTMFSV